MNNYKKGCKLIENANIYLKKYKLTNDKNYFYLYQKDFKEGISLIVKDAKKGNVAALNYLKDLEKEGKLKINYNKENKKITKDKIIIDPIKSSKKEKDIQKNNEKYKDNKILYILLIILLILLFLIGFFFLYDEYRDYKNYKENSISMMEENLSDYEKREIVETCNIIRNALYLYIDKNKVVPNNLNELIKEYPNNYLSSIPYEPYSKSYRIYNIYDGSGGYVYDPSIYDNSLPLSVNVVKILKPNIKNIPSIENDLNTFNKIGIFIDTSSKKLLVHSGNTILKTYPVGLGKATTPTPLGSYFINSKVSNPKSIYGEGIYGTRALELSNKDYAIHGTNQPELIGSYVSNGCIRMKNEDIEELYSFIPLNTPIIISEKPNLNLKEISSINNNGLNNSPTNNNGNSSGNSNEFNSSNNGNSSNSISNGSGNGNGNSNEGGSSNGNGSSNGSGNSEGNSNDNNGEGNNGNDKGIGNGKGVGFGESPFSQSSSKSEETPTLNSWNN